MNHLNRKLTADFQFVGPFPLKAANDENGVYFGKRVFIDSRETLTPVVWLEKGKAYVGLLQEIWWTSKPINDEPQTVRLFRPQQDNFSFMQAVIVAKTWNTTSIVEMVKKQSTRIAANAAPFPFRLPTYSNVQKAPWTDPHPAD